MREIARLLLPSVRWDPSVGFAPARPAVARALAAGVGGFLIEGGTCEAVAELAAEIRRDADVAPIIAIAPSTLGAADWGSAPVALPPAGAVASLRDPLVIRRVAHITAREARRAGCNAVFAPPCDVAVTPTADAFGTGATTVASAATEWIDAAQAEGVLCFAGMFPGGGRIARTAFDMPTVRDGDDSLYATDLVPFRAAIDAGVAGFSIANARYTALDSTGTPAPLSRPILQTLLRGQLGFDGLAIADASSLAAQMRARVPASELVAAGVDLVVRPANVDVELRALMDAVQSGRLDGERVHDAVTRQRARAEMAGAPAALHDRSADDASWLGDVAERAISTIRGRSVHVTSPVEVAVCGAAGPEATAMVGAFSAGLTDAGAPGLIVRQVTTPSALVRSALVVLVAPAADRGSTATGVDGRSVDAAAALCAEARRLGRDSAAVWCAHPSREVALPGAALLVACWSPSSAMLRAAGRWFVRRV
jgi:beta-glucosidase-like glycosyl hydrolase